MILIPFAAHAVEYCQEVDARNLEHIQEVVDIVNARNATSLTIGEFMSEVLRKKVAGEMARKINREAEAQLEAAESTREQILAEAAQRFAEKQTELGETW